ncbi:MAG: hypothetical protein EOQ39_18690 [Mesorhizobium sp.]|uniref:hypothetical protein n=1 Tax=Mesorhizobium sp. TaxID=1871066 RepID=UPI000FE69663|nr:hypothetical protein [Mesorhizobium sp.]RWB08801.1 MAG: hypothetical protein EOQ37_04650 [Mesorhizobium sp.]RWB13548.1 MAG: hypothetical protein EOQ39_18690 [Mesorhizobium sp.]
MSVYLHLFHGRDTATEDMDGFGYEGPTLGPFKYVHLTYMSDLKFSMEKIAFSQAFPEEFNDWVEKGFSNADGEFCEWHFDQVGDLIKFKGKFYGDWSVTSDE